MPYNSANRIRLYPSHIADFFAILFLGFCIYLNYNHPIEVDDDLQFWSLAHLILHASPIYFYIKNFYRQKINFPFVETLAAFNILHFGLPVFFIKVGDFQLGKLNVNALEVSFYAYLLFYATYYIFQKNWRIKPIEIIPKNTSAKRLKFYAYMMFTAYLLSKITSESTFTHLGNIGIYIYVGLMINLWRDRQLKIQDKIIFIPCILYDLLDRAVGGLIAPLALMVFFISLCIILSNSSRLFIVIGVILFVWFYNTFSDVKSTFRTKVWYESNDYTIFDKIALIQDLASEKKKENSVEYIDNYKGKEQFLWRYSYQLSALSMVMIKTPTTVPYWDGTTYLPLFSKFIPRVIWEDKPEENMGYRFGVTYGVIRASNTRTSINTPILSELYINFGLTGIYLGSVLLGILYAWLTLLFNSKMVSYSSKVIGMALIFPLVIWESNFSLIFGNLLLVTIILIVLYRLMISVFKIT